MCIRDRNWIDKNRKTNELNSFRDMWERFIADKPIWKLEQFVSRFNKQINTIESLRLHLINE